MRNRDYLNTYRRLLIDMHVPDWDVFFLKDLDVVSAVRAATATDASSLMVYFQSHTGLCNWPTASGKQHPALAGRDVMGPLLSAGHEAGLPICAYYSVNYNNWAYHAHPQWRLVSGAGAARMDSLLQSPRYGVCCLNQPGYAQFVALQINEIAATYDIDAFFFDMVWWASVCVCESCQKRYRAERSRDIPGIVDWLNPLWCDFQACRERWLSDFATDLRLKVHQYRPGIPVYHNFALGAANWTRGVSFDSARAHDFLGGDFYGDSHEQLIISRLMINLSEQRPVEFMTTVTTNLAEHERLKPQSLLNSQSLAATASQAAFLAIMAYDPDGRINPAMIDRAKRMFAAAKPYEAYRGGNPIEQIGVYFSGQSKMNFRENGVALCNIALDNSFDYPHLHAVNGACRVLQQAHLPFGVITRRQLGQLNQYQVIVLPNVLRMDHEELAAIRRYVECGGRIYASLYTSLTMTDGTRTADFKLADVFGCHFDAIEEGRIVYLSPLDATCKTAIAPERAMGHWLKDNDRTGAMRLAPQCVGRVLSTLSLPYGYPSRGRTDGHDWSSIHSFPPWQATELPTVVAHEFGAGQSVYSAFDLESGNTISHDALFLSLIRSLLGNEAAFGANAHPNVWMFAFEQSIANRHVISFINRSDAIPPLPVPGFDFMIRPPRGRQFVRLREVPACLDLPYTLDPDGSLHAHVDSLESLIMLTAEYD